MIKADSLRGGARVSGRCSTRREREGYARDAPHGVVLCARDEAGDVHEADPADGDERQLGSPGTKGGQERGGDALLEPRLAGGELGVDELVHAERAAVDREDGEEEDARREALGGLATTAGRDDGRVDRLGAVRRVLLDEEAVRGERVVRAVGERRAGEDGGEEEAAGGVKASARRRGMRRKGSMEPTRNRGRATGRGRPRCGTPSGSRRAGREGACRRRPTRRTR